MNVIAPAAGRALHDADAHAWIARPGGKFLSISPWTADAALAFDPPPHPAPIAGRRKRL